MPSSHHLFSSTDLPASLSLTVPLLTAWVVVGAPRAQTQAPGVSRAGAVYRCSPTLADDCTPLPFDTLSNTWEDGVQVDDKSDQWFGATVVSKAGVLVVSGLQSF
ncbi:hypothetical protein FHG87_012874 [Trinorchestia longiramus]|nr:hypothetical protein FHG87_012874 [Trinorchestia longiramus]